MPSLVAGVRVFPSSPIKDADGRNKSGHNARDNSWRGESRMTAVLEVRDLAVTFGAREGLVKAVNGVSFSVNRGEVLGLVGESGSGKSVTGLAIMGLIDAPGRIAGGSIKFEGQELVGKSEDELRSLRGPGPTAPGQWTARSRAIWPIFRPSAPAGTGRTREVRLVGGRGDPGTRARVRERVRVREVAIPAQVATCGLGDVAVSGVAGDVDITSGTGDVKAEGIAARRVSLSTGTGDVTATMAEAPDSLEASSGTGDVTATVPSGAYRLDLSTGVGDTSTTGIQDDPTSPHLLSLSTGTGDVTAIGTGR